MVSDDTTKRGLLYILSAYCLWGILPLYFLALSPAGPYEIVAWRIIFSVLFCVIVMAFTGFGNFIAVLKQPKPVLTLAVAGVLIYINWQVYVWSVANDHLIDASLGYFINPLVTVVLGVLVLRERMSRFQMIATGLLVGAIAVMAIGAGGLPWVSIALALSFGLYGLVKNRVGRSVDALTGLTIESTAIIPIAVVVLVLVNASTGIVFGHAGVGNAVLLTLAGPATAIPLLLFAAASRRLGLISIGMAQFINPVMQFLLGYLVLHEAMPPARWVGFGLVWLALVFIATEWIVIARSSRHTQDI